ncbi:VOC family protein [Diaphorobacter aerolatus]|uniref:VOC family protein n=1 Tax=Diaphorobacter aerolatus TaxID=1288495 RepID=A0A7H0GHI0_9BURK|nr:VOC family protein [Diaphorobacter aerolatus]QNP47746.1 VOC family protein [Diaphorobacter aerolatus]
MHKSKLGNIVIDCQSIDLLAAARFWSAALGYPLPNTLLADAASGYIQLITPPGDTPVAVQRVIAPSSAHLDIEADSLPDEVARLEKLGASVVDTRAEHIVLQAPTGHRFCVAAHASMQNFASVANVWQ